MKTVGYQKSAVFCFNFILTIPFRNILQRIFFTFAPIFSHFD